MNEYERGAQAALALFSKAASAPVQGVNVAPLAGSAVAQAATNVHPQASRVANSLVSGAAGGLLNALMAPSGDRLRQGAIGFASDAVGGALGPLGMVASPLINMGLQKLTAPSDEKTADHADDRLKERIKTEFPPGTLNQLREQAKHLELAPGRYYLPMKDHAGQTAAIAAFKTVGPKDQLVLATVLTPKNKPPANSTSLSHLMKQPLGEKITEVAASPKTYTIRKNSDGRYTCTCKDFKFRARAAGTNCKHIEAHLGQKKESANRLERHLLAQGGVSDDVKAKLRGQFGRLTPTPTAKSKALTSQALALEPGKNQESSLRSMRTLLQTPHYPDKDALARTRRINELSLTPKLRQLGGKSLDAHYWKDKDPTFFYDEKKRFATPGEYRAKSMRLGEEPAPTGLRAEHVLRAAAAKKPIDTKLSPEQGELVMYPEALKVQRERLNKQRTTPGQAKPWDATDMRQTLEHEAGERKMVLEGVRKGKPTTPYSSHWGSEADVAANQVAAKDPKSQWVPNNPDSFIEKEHWDRLYKQHGGTRGSPIPSDSRQSRSLDAAIAKTMARAPLNEKTRPDLTSALDAGVAGMPLHPELEARLMRDFSKLKPDLPAVAAKGDKSENALDVLKKRTRMKTSADRARQPGEPIEEQEEPQAGTAPMAPPPKKSWLPAAGAGLLAGVGAYKLLRRSSFSANPGLSALQQRASTKGFHRVVDLSRDPSAKDRPFELLNKFKQVRRGDETVGGAIKDVAQNLAERWQPKVDMETRSMTPLNKLKFFLQEGGEAIPISSDPKTMETFVVGKPKGMNVKGVVANRHIQPYYGEQSPAKFIRGGTDIEGSKATQRAATLLGTRGKGYEAALVQKHAPGAMPKSVSDLSSFFKKPTGNSARERLQAIESIQSDMLKKLQAQGMDQFALKPAGGVQSEGFFPLSTDNWKKQLGKFEKHIANPTNVANLEKAERMGGGELAYYLHKHNLLEGHTLHNALKDPKSVMAQHWLPGAMGEWRVNAFQGAAPEYMMTPRYLSADPAGAAKDLLGLSDINRGELREFVEKHLSSLPKDLRRGSYGLDVMPFKGKDGKPYFKILEMNPHERSGVSGSQGGGSGFLDSAVIPWAGHAHYRAATGRHSEPVSALGGLAAGTAAAGLARALTPEQQQQQEEEDTPHPVG